MRNKKILIITAIVLSMCIALILTACLPQDTRKLIDKAQSIWNNSSEKSITDNFGLEKAEIELPNMRVNKLKIIFRGGDISMTRSIKGKNAFIELKASSIIMEAFSGDAPTSLTFLGINTNAFMNVKFLFRLRVADDKLSAYYSIDNLNGVMESFPEKIEKTLMDETVEVNTASIVRTMSAQSLLGNPRVDGTIDNNKMLYTYVMSDNARINNELFRIPKLLVSASEYGDWNLAEVLNELFGQSDAEDIANSCITYEPLTVENKLYAAKGGHYFKNRFASISATVTLVPSVINKLLTKLDISLSANKDTICILKFTIDSDYSLKSHI